MSGIVPMCLAMVLCRAVTRDERTGEPIIDRAFELFEVEFFPTQSPPIIVWMQFRNGNGATPMELTMEHVPSGRLDPEVVVVVRFTLHFADPNAVLEQAARFDNGLHFERPGRYRLRLAAGGAAMLQRDFMVFPNREVRG